MGKSPFSISHSSSRQRPSKPTSVNQSSKPTAVFNGTAFSPSTPSPRAANLIGDGAGKGKKKAAGARLWMRFDTMGISELVEYDRSTVIQKASIPARDMRILGPIFSHSSSILAREKAMVVNLEFIKAIVTAEEVLVLDPLHQEVLQFVDQLRLHLPHKSDSKMQGAGTVDISDGELHVLASEQLLPVPEVLPFEFQVLEIALEVVCSFLDKNVVDLETDAYLALDELTRNVSTKNLEHVRSLKSSLTHLLARVQKVRDEIEHLLDDNEDMAHLYLTRKWIQNQQSEAVLSDAFSNSISINPPHLRRLGSNRSGSLSSHFFYDHNVEDLEMLLEAYFIQLDGIRNKILSVREYIDDTEDYVNIQLDNQRNELIQLQLTLTIASFAISIETLVAAWMGMNIPCALYQKNGIFEIFIGGLTLGCLLIFLLVLGYARWTKLIDA